MVGDLMVVSADDDVVWWSLPDWVYETVYGWPKRGEALCDHPADVGRSLGIEAGCEEDEMMDASKQRRRSKKTPHQIGSKLASDG